MSESRRTTRKKNSHSTKRLKSLAAGLPNRSCPRAIAKAVVAPNVSQAHMNWRRVNDTVSDQAYKPTISDSTSALTTVSEVIRSRWRCSFACLESTGAGGALVIVKGLLRGLGPAYASPLRLREFTGDAMVGARATGK